MYMYIPDAELGETQPEVSEEQPPEPEGEPEKEPRGPDVVC